MSRIIVIDTAAFAAEQPDYYPFSEGFSAMFLLPYQTTPCQAYVLSGIVTALQHAAIDGQLTAARTGKNVPIEGLFEVPPYVKAVAPFGHPLLIDVNGRQMMVLDTRAFVRYDAVNHRTVVTTPSEYEFLLLRGRLSELWRHGQVVRDLFALNNIVPLVYSRLLAESIVRRLALNPMDQQGLMILSCYYYFCQFQNTERLMENQVVRMATKIATITRINAQTVLETLDKLKLEDGSYKAIGNIDDFVKTLQSVLTSPRLQLLNVGLLYASIGGVWFGANARENVAISLEYPPYFIALAYAALTDRSYHGALFTKLVEQCNRHNAGTDFVRSLANLLEMMTHA